MNFPVTYSTARPEDISGLFEKESGEKANQCFLLKRGFHDTFLLKTEKKKIIAKIYRHDFPGELLEAQLGLISFLNNRNVPVSSPFCFQKNKSIIPLEFPEGKRNLVYYNFAEGERIRVPEEKHAALLGNSLAAFHESTRIFAGDFPQKINNDILHEEIEKVFSGRLEKEEKGILKSFVSEAFSKVPGNHPVICHGDIQPENFHFTDDKVIFFDLDFCGSSDPLFDLGSFYWYDHQSRTRAVMRNFISSYSDARKLSDEEIRSISWFSLIKAIHHMIRVAEFLNGRSSPLWSSKDIRLFIKKLNKWHEEKCGKTIPV